MKRLLTGTAALLVAVAALGGGSARAITGSQFQTIVNTILAEAYQPNYVPVGTDTAFPTDPGETNTVPVPNTAPAQDYTSGSIPGSPDSPAWPSWFKPVQFSEGFDQFWKRPGEDGSTTRGIRLPHACSRWNLPQPAKRRMQLCCNTCQNQGRPWPKLAPEIGPPEVWEHAAPFSA